MSRSSLNPAQAERMPGRIRVDLEVVAESTSSAAFSTFAPSDMTRSWAATKSSTHRSMWICCGGVPSGQSGGTWSGAS